MHTSPTNIYSQAALFRHDLPPCSAASTSIADVLMAEHDPLDTFGSFSDSVLASMQELSGVADTTSMAGSETTIHEDSGNPSYTIQGTYMLQKDDRMDLLQDFSLHTDKFGTSIFQFPDLPIGNLFGGNVDQSHVSGLSSYLPSAASSSASEKTMVSSLQHVEQNVPMTSSASHVMTSSSTSSLLHDFGSINVNNMQPIVSSEFSQVPYSVAPLSVVDSSKSVRPSFSSFTQNAVTSYFDSHPVMGGESFQSMGPYKSPDAVTMNRRRLFAEHRHQSELTLSPTNRYNIDSISSFYYFEYL